MDNSPRFSNGKDPLAVDALAQQGLSALCISHLALSLGNREIQAEFHSHYEAIRQLINSRYWDEGDGFYYDLLPDGKTFSKVRTPASFWPVLARMASPDQTRRMAEYVKDPNELGGVVPWTTVSRSSPEFNREDGNYWQGAVWLPTAYAGIRALTENGQMPLAEETAEAVLRHMYLTWRDFSPRTIWECYSPSRPEPARHGESLVRQNFCGWSALGPIALFIESVLGFYEMSAASRLIKWSLHQPGKHGIRRLRLGEVLTDIIADGTGVIQVTSNLPYTLVVNGNSHAIRSGTQTIPA
jgi:glycogen debranching enzyme